MAGSPSDRAIVDDDFYRDLAYRLVDLVYSGEPPLREHPLDAPVRLPCNPLPEPDLATAEHHEVVFTGGMMGMMRGGMMGGRMMDMRAMMRHGMAWAINGVAASGHVMEPVLDRKSTRLNSSHKCATRMPSSALKKQNHHTHTKTDDKNM